VTTFADRDDDGPLTGHARALLEAFTAISSDLDLRSVLTRIVEAATQLTGARYGALGVIGSEGFLVEFVTTGLDDETRAAIGDLPHGRGILGLLIHRPEAIRLHDLAAHGDSAGFPDHHPPMSTFLGVPVRIRGTVFGNLYLTEKAGGEDFTAYDEALVESLAGAAGYVIENARAYGQSERRRQWLEATAVLTEVLQPPVDLDDALARVTETVRWVSGALASAVVSLDRSSSVPAVVVADLSRPGDSERLDALLAEVRAAGHEQSARDIEVDGWHALVLPLRAHLAQPGALVVVFDSALAPQDVEERELLASFADQTALALDRAQAVADREQLMVLSDRERIARDLHDVVIQRLFATGLRLQGVAMTVDAEAAGRLETAVDEIDTTIKAIRGSIFELQNRGEPSLRGEVRALVREYAALLGFTPEVTTSGPLDTAVPAGVRDQLLPVLREALSNVARHARATCAEVELRADAREVSLVVRDDGRGLTTHRHESGLANVRLRAEALGGTVTLVRRQPRGTELVWLVPLTAQSGPKG
jgi:signal transduction histidine kinase